MKRNTIKWSNDLYLFLLCACVQFRWVMGAAGVILVGLFSSSIPFEFESHRIASHVDDDDDNTWDDETRRDEATKKERKKKNGIRRRRRRRRRLLLWWMQMMMNSILGRIIPAPSPSCVPLATRSVNDFLLIPFSRYYFRFFVSSFLFLFTPVALLLLSSSSSSSYSY